MPKILVVEDEVDVNNLIRTQFENEGYDVAQAFDGPSALRQVDAHQPDLVILDWMMPGMDGLSVCREIRRNHLMPVIMLTARGEEIDRVVGLEVGADDYVSKPYRMRELVARIRATLRRAPLPEQVASAAVVEVGHVRLDAERHEVFVRNKPVKLPLKEFELLEALLNNAGRVLTRDTLIDRVWGSAYVGDTKTLDVHIKRLRSKVEADPGSPVSIVTIRGLGYKFEPPARSAPGS